MASTFDHFPADEDLRPEKWAVFGLASDRLERPIQQAFRKLVKKHWPQARVVAIPNAGKRGLKAVRDAKAEGMQTGFPDTICIMAGKVAFIEFKRGNATASDLSDNQAEWMVWLSGCGFPAAVMRDEVAAWAWLQERWNIVGAPVPAFWTATSPATDAARGDIRS